MPCPILTLERGKVNSMMARRGFSPFVGLLATAILVALGGVARAGFITIDVTADFDGRDQLIIRGDSLQYQHFENTPVGLHNSSYPSTILTTTLDGTPGLSNYAWTPTWPAGTGTGALSSVFAGLSPAAPSQDSSVSLDVLQGRGTVSLIQLPSASNAYTTILEFNDDAYFSDALYEAKLTFITAAAVPEPSSLMLLAAGAAVGLGSAARRVAVRRTSR